MKTKLTEVIMLTKSYNLQDFKDWMHWHLDVIKFDCCHIFDNESSVNIKSVCDSYGDRVTYEKIIGTPYQYEYYTKYINNECRAWWVLPIDDDEFLWMKNFDNVDDMILYYQSKWPDMVKFSMRWKNMFPKDAQAKRGNQSLMDFNTEANENWAKLFDGGNKAVKTFVKTTGKVEYSKAKENQTHNPILNNQMSYMCNGERLKGNWYLGPYTDNDVRLLHYQYKSKDEWVWKCNNRTSAYGWKVLYYKPYENLWKRMI
jgi:hypothetical protein